MKRQHQSQLGYRYPVTIYNYFLDFFSMGCFVILFRFFFSLGGWYLLPGNSKYSQRNWFHQPVTNVFKNGAWLCCSNYRKCFRHLAWSLHNLWHQASEEIAFSISFWHFSSWQCYRMLLEPKVKCNKLCKLCQKKPTKNQKHEQSQFRMPSQGATGVGNRNTWL